MKQLFSVLFLGGILSLSATPSVRINAPHNGETFAAPATIPIVAYASDDTDGYHLQVEFFAGTNSLGFGTFIPSLCPAPYCPNFALTWSNVPPGEYTLTAKATNTKGETGVSEPIRILVSNLPVVTVRATDAPSSESGGTGRFIFTRSGGTDTALNVFFRLSGSASNGVDYLALGNSVTIPAGASNALLSVTAVDDPFVEGTEAVELRLIQESNSIGYLIGTPSSAVVLIVDNDVNTNHPPSVRILSPTNLTVFAPPATIPICVDARDSDGYVTMVEFFAGTNRLAVRTITNSTVPGALDFCFVWTNVPPGEYLLKAKATDNQGLSAFSEPVKVYVRSYPGLPLVSIRATDAHAAEGSTSSNIGTNVAVFTVSRTEPLEAELLVSYLIGGTASNGVDYVSISNVVVIPAGAPSANIVIRPIDDLLTELTETVNLRLLPVLCAAIFPPPPGCYELVSPVEAVAFIEDNDPINTNRPPTVRIVTPTNLTVFAAPATIPICAEALDNDGGYVATVEFFAGTNSLGVRTNNPLGGGPMNPFCILWTNVPPGEYFLKAKATDNQGLIAFSESVKVLVRSFSGLPFVSIRATDSHAAEGHTDANNLGTNIAVFTVSRTEPIDAELLIAYRIGGTASNGVDYVSISNAVVIPAGAASANIVIRPIDDLLVELTESVSISLSPVACAAIFPPPPGCYELAPPIEAVAFIEDNDRITNAPPKVHIIAPTNGATFTGPLHIPLSAEASDADDSVIGVDFFAGDRLLGSDFGTNKDHYTIVWSNALPGLYSLRGRASDSRGAVGWSEPVRITVLGTNLPPTNLPPVVTIVAADSLAGEGTNCCRWYSNSAGVPDHYLCTNNAAFIVRRTGPTNAGLVVTYGISGSASNGVDYAAIRGKVEIPAGENSARIAIHPIDDAIPECTETVRLQLRESATTLASYVVGWPAKAAAIIVDNDQLPPGTTLLCDRTFHLCVPATNGFSYRLECSLDLKNWLPLTTNTVSESAIHFADPESEEFPNRFYRVVPLDGR